LQDPRRLPRDDGARGAAAVAPLPRARPAPSRGADARATLRWGAAATVAALAGALWLREPGVLYLAVCAAATAAALLLARLHPVRARRLWATPCAAMAAVFCVAVAPTQWTLTRIDRAWDAYAADVQARSTARLGAALTDAARALTRRAERALDAPVEPRPAFRWLAPLVRDGRQEAVVLYRAGVPAAWAGLLRIVPDSGARPYAASSNGFYVTLQATARRGTQRAVATEVVHAEPPADHLVSALDARIARRSGVRGFDIMPPSAAAEGGAPGAARLVFSPGGTPLFVAAPRALERGEARLRAVEDGRTRGAPLLALALAFFGATLWRRPAPLARRLAALAVLLAVVGLVPLNAFSNASRFFDPSFYFAPLGGPFTASAAALGLTSALALLGLLAVLRSPIRLRSRWPALAAVVVVAGAGPFLLRALSRGIVLPPWGSPVVLWLAWELTLFLAATCVLLAGASAGRTALGARRGLPPWLAPALAAAAAVLGPALWDAPGRWPSWYPAVWVAAIAALALTRRARGFVLAAAAVAGCGAATLVWGATARKRVELAERDVAGLMAFDPYARTLLERFGAQLAAEEPPITRTDLLQSYVAADLASAGFPVALTAWTTGRTPGAELVMAPVEPRPEDLAVLLDEVRRSGQPTIRQAPGAAGVALQLGVPHPRGQMTTVVVGPRTRLLPSGDPRTALLGLEPETATEPPYSLSLVPTDPRLPAAPPAGTGESLWGREGNELHGDWTVRTADGPMRAHVEVELRSLTALVQRGTLVVLLDLAVVAVLWTLAALADGGLGRWLRARQRVWRRSFRARLTLVLFGFFIVPSVVFVVWSYRRLQADDRQSRELLVRETLRAVAAGDDFARLDAAAERFGTPLLLYGGGGLRAVSDTLYDALAPLGRLLPPGVHLRVGLGDAIAASRIVPVGRAGTLVGYVPARTPGGERVVLAAPARTNELVLDQRRRDLGVLVLFSTALGALAALGLSGVAARQLSRPIGVLRAAALAVARGEREPVPPGEPPSEFVPVFSAFRRMAADLRESQSALEEAQRRTAAVLRNVASGVVAVGGDGRVVLANPRAALLLECELAPGTGLDCIGSEEIERRVRAFIAGALEEEEFDVELGRRQLHGRLTRLSRGAGGAVVLTLDDVTELARAQRVLAWGEMARQIAHEIKNPLTPIRLGVQHLRRARQNPRVDFDAVLEQNVGRILAEIDRLDEIARAFSRYGTAPAERPPTEATDVAAVVRDVVALERLGQDEEGAAGRVHWEVTGADAPAVAEARDDELREVLINVLENARLANARRVGVHVERDKEAGRVRVAVADDGEGIPADVLPKIFEPHFSTRTSGSGLGLAISRRIIDGWGGTIDVASERGFGTTVTLALRAALATDGAAPPAGTPPV